MDALRAREKGLLSELSEVIKREEIYISVLSSLNGDDAEDIEQELRDIRKDRQKLTHELNLVRSKINNCVKEEE